MKKTANKWVFLALTFQGKKIPMKMNNMSHVWQSLEGFLCAPRKFHQQQSQEEKKNRHTSGRGFVYALLPQ